VYHSADPKDQSQYSFNCHAFLDNTSLCILEISINVATGSSVNSSFHWLLIHKQDLSVRELRLKSRDDSNWVQERFFDIGYLKYNASEGIFIPAGNQQMHPLALQECSDIPAAYLNAVAQWTQGYQQSKDGTTNY
jgi:hypothetical protein